MLEEINKKIDLNNLEIYGEDFKKRIKDLDEHITVCNINSIFNKDYTESLNKMREDYENKVFWTKIISKWTDCEIYVDKEIFEYFLSYKQYSYLDFSVRDVDRMIMELKTFIIEKELNKNFCHTQ